MRKRIKTIRTEKVSSSNAGTRHELQRTHVLGQSRPITMRKDSPFLPNELPLHIKGGLIFDI